MAQIAELIKYEGDNSTFVWKHPCEDFNSLTQLIVHESQEAVFFMNGQALDLFGPGRYTLETQNVPLLGRILNRLTGGKSPFHCEVYFINKTVQMDLKWGTDAKVRYIDPQSGLPIELGASGSMNLMASDSRKLLIKLVGTMNGIAWEDTGANFTRSLKSTFRPLINTAVRTGLPQAIKSRDFDIFEIDEHLEELSQALLTKILPGFEEYGLTIPQFYLTTVVLPEEDPGFKRLRELHTIGLQRRSIEAEAQLRAARALAEADVTAAQRQIEMEKQVTQTEIAKREAERSIIAAQTEAQRTKLGGFAEAEVMAAKGYTQKDVLAADVQKAYAAGIGTMGGAGGSAMSDIVGLGIGLQAAGAMGGQIGNMFAAFGANREPAPQQNSIKCANCGTTLPEGAKFCLNCGEKVAFVDTVVCPQCGKTVLKGKFCPECGHKFISACPKCGKELAEGAKFCPECGEKL